MRGLRRKLTVMAVGTIVGTLTVVSAPQAGADPIGPRATAQFGIKFEDRNENGQCRLINTDIYKNEEWVSEGTWTTRIAVDTDSRDSGCDMWFGLNNVDGSLTGVNLIYSFNPPGPQCGGGATNKPIPYVPVAASFPYFTMLPIFINTDNKPGGCELNLTISGRSDIALDVRWEYNDNRDQCGGDGIPQEVGTDAQRFTVRNGVGGTIIFDTDNRDGACFLSFRLRHI